MDVVFGATGLVGGDIVRRLRAAGRSVRAGLRGGITHPKAEALMQAGVEVVEGDLTRAATLEGACQGAQTVVTTVTSMPIAEHDGLRRVDLVGTLALIDAAERAGCERFIYLSMSEGCELDSPLQLAKRSCERHLAASRMEAVVLRPSAFMEIWLSPHLGFDPANGVVHLNGSGAAPIRYISAFDVAAIAANAVLHADPGGIWELGGPEAIAPWKSSSCSSASWESPSPSSRPPPPSFSRRTKPRPTRSPRRLPLSSSCGLRAIRAECGGGGPEVRCDAHAGRGVRRPGLTVSWRIMETSGTLIGRRFPMTDKKPDFSNVVGGSSSTARPASQGQTSASPRTYIVQKGDSLWKIAKKYYGNGNALDSHPRGQQGPNRRPRSHPARLDIEDSGMRYRTCAIALLAVSGLVAHGCKNKETPARPSPTTTSTRPSAASPVTVVNVTLGKAIGGDKRVTSQSDSFAPGDTVYASVDTQGAAPSAALAAKWTYQDGQTVNEETLSIAPTGPATTEFHVSKPGGLPAGSYKVEILLDGVLVRTATFKVT
jgi:NADH dehydrogenase